MKKTNFVVIFWLLLAIISFVVFLMNFYSIWESISYLIFPAPDDSYYADSNMVKRKLVSSIPMLLIVSCAFYFSLKQGLKTYKEL